MEEQDEIVTSLLDDDDGTCRDVNFDRPTWEGLDELIEFFESSFERESAWVLPLDGEARELSGQAFASTVRDGGNVHFQYGAGSGFLRRFAVFGCPDENGLPFVEITFFPGDIVPTRDLKQEFVEWANAARERLQARRYYVRYENASWEFGDTGATSGVFLVSDVGEVDA